MKIQIETYIPFSDIEEIPNNYTNELIEELIKVSGLVKIPIDNFGEAIVNISKVPENRINQLKASYSTYFKHDPLELLLFESTVEFEPVYEFDLKDLPDFVTKEAMNSSLLLSIYQARFRNFIILTQIGIPGSLHIDKGLFFQDGIYSRDFKPLGTCLISVAYDNNSKWPHMEKIPIIDVWDYIRNKTNILTEKSNSNIENGLNAFTYLFDESYNAMYNLFWAMSGIEALYADGEIGIGYQIDRKAKVFLGPPKGYKKVLTKLYNFRSKFIHGSMSIPINNAWLSNDDEDKYHDEFYEMEYTAVRLLTATLKKIISNRMESFNFIFKLEK